MYGLFQYLAGPSVLVGRLTSLTLSVGLAGLTVLIARRLGGDLAAIVALLCLGVSADFMRAGSYANNVILSAFLAMLGTWWLWGDWSKWSVQILATACWSLAVLARLSFAPALAMVVGFILWHHRRRVVAVWPAVVTPGLILLAGLGSFAMVSVDHTYFKLVAAQVARQRQFDMSLTPVADVSGLALKLGPLLVNGTIIFTFSGSIRRKKINIHVKIKMKRKELVLLTAIVFLGTVLRLIRLGARNLWYDEAFAILYAEKSLAAMIYGTMAQVEGAAADVHPLLYYFSLHFWMGLVGQSTFAVRLFSLLFGLGAIALVFYLAAELFDRRTGFIAALLVAISPFHIHYSQEARMYSLLCFLSLLAIYAFVRARKDGSLKKWALFTVAATLSLYTHNLAFLPLLTLDLFVLLKREWRLIKPLCLSHLGMAVLFAPWLSLVPGQFGKVRQAYWIGRPGLAELIRTLMVFHFNLPAPERFLPVVLFFSLLILALALYRMVRVRGRSAEKKDSLYLILLLAFLPVALMFVISQFKSVYIERGVLPAAVAYYIVIAALLAELRMPRTTAAILSAPVLIVLVISLVYHYTYAGFPRSPFEEAVAYLREHYRAGDAIVHDNKLTFFPCYYYDRDLPQAFVPDLAGAGSDTLALPTQEALGLFATPLEKAASGHERVWFVIFQKALDEEWFRALGYSEHPDVAWMEAHYHRVDAVTFNDLDVYLYENP